MISSLIPSPFATNDGERNPRYPAQLEPTHIQSLSRSTQDTETLCFWFPKLDSNDTPDSDISPPPVPGLAWKDDSSFLSRPFRGEDGDSSGAVGWH